MSKINWDEYKKYKHERPNLKELDKRDITQPEHLEDLLYERLAK